MDPLVATLKRYSWRAGPNSALPDFPVRRVRHVVCLGAGQQAERFGPRSGRCRHRCDFNSDVDNSTVLGANQLVLPDWMVPSGGRYRLRIGVLHS